MGSSDAEYDELQQKHEYLTHVFDYQRDGYTGHGVTSAGASDGRILDDAEHEHDESNNAVRQPEQQAKRIRSVHVFDLPAEFVENVS